MDCAALEESLSSLGLEDLRRITGGWQSLAVYDAHVGGRHVVVKVLDSDRTDRDVLSVRLDLLSRLGTANRSVCAPVPVRGHLINQVIAQPEAVYAIAYEFAEGDSPDINEPDEAAEMGRVLAELHASMAELAPCDLPGLAAFPPSDELVKVANDLGVQPGRLAVVTPNGPRQLLHGDFSAQNMRVNSARWRVFDFDDCACGPVELDLANSLYFVLFDAMTGSDPHRYRRFREGFLVGYQDRAGVAQTDAVLDALITRRVLALASWLADPATAPAGVRTAPDGWRTTLGAFIQRYLETVI